MYIEKSEFLSKGFDLDNNNNNTSTTSTTSTSTMNNNNKIKNLITIIKQKAIESRKEIDESESGKGVKGKLKSILKYLEDRIHPEETILQQFTKINDNNLVLSCGKSTALTVYYPASIGQRRAHRYSRVVVRQRIQHHKLWIGINMLLIPVTFAATILPGPNVFLAYNLYRLYGHYQALKGCNNFHQFSSTHKHLLFKPCNELESFHNHNHHHHNNNQILSERLNIPGLTEFSKKLSPSSSSSSSTSIYNNNNNNSEIPSK
eukprot:gene5740-7139_t